MYKILSRFIQIRLKIQIGTYLCFLQNVMVLVIVCLKFCLRSYFHSEYETNLIQGAPTTEKPSFLNRHNFFSLPPYQIDKTVFNYDPGLQLLLSYITHHNLQPIQSKKKIGLALQSWSSCVEQFDSYLQTVMKVQPICLSSNQCNHFSSIQGLVRKQKPKIIFKNQHTGCL